MAMAGLGAQVAKETDAATSEAAKSARSLLTRLLGPSADVIGAHWAERLRERTLARLTDKTEKRAQLQRAAGQSPGIANARVVAEVFTSAQFSDSEVVAEYLSGVLASSRDAEGKNDAGVTWSSLISRLSTDQLKLHYFVYASARQRFIGKDLYSPHEVHNVEVVLDSEPFAAAADMSAVEFSDAIDGLMREGLIGDSYRYGPSKFLFERERARPNTSIHYPNASGLRVRLTVHGVRLFTWGTGYGDRGIEAYADPSINLGAVDAPLPTVTPLFVKDEVVKTDKSRLPTKGAQSS